MIATNYSEVGGGSCSFPRKRHVEDRTEISEEKRQRMTDYHYPRDENRIIIPQGWLDCPSFGHEIGFIIPSKVPLSESYNSDLPPDKRYAFKQWTSTNEKKKLGLVIDLTNTTRYYNPNTELWQKRIKHVKIPCSGHDSLPDHVSVNTFVNEVSQFERDNFSKKYVLVHCTHGHNRTGFMIVHYLMRSTPMTSVTQALKMFSDARPPGIYKPDYIDALYSFYHEIKPQSVSCPQTPEWKMSENEPPRSCLSVQENNQEEEKVENKMSNNDVLGDEIPYRQELSYQEFCYDMLKIRRGEGVSLYFPGSHPVSLDREQFQLLKQRYYYATWKADGMRYMMLLTREGCYLMDRMFRFRRVQMRFPCSDFQRLHHYTLLDGEMVVDTFLDGEKREKQVRRYLVYDLVAINGRSVVERPFSERWNIIDREVIKPRNDEKKVISHWYKYEMEPFAVRIKAFCLLSALEKKIFKELIPSLTHEADGVIFQGWDDPYVYRENRDLLKWKYPHLNSVDFLFEMSKDGRQKLFLIDRGRKTLMEGYSVEFRGDGWNKPESYCGKILECSWDRDEEVWVAMRIRVDKNKPNGLVQGLRVIKSIMDNITEEVLLDEIRQIIRLPMYVERIRMDIQAAERRRHGNR